MATEVITDIEISKTPTFKKTEEKNFIEIEFDKIFKRDISYLNKFCLKKKRTYYNISQIIIDYNNIIFDYDKTNTLITNYLAIKYKINSNLYKSQKEFIDEIYTILFTEDLINIIKNFVNKNYKFDLDSKKIDKYIAGLQFTDNHAKILHMISTGSKFIIPLILEYIMYSKDENIEINEFIISCFDPLFDIFRGNVDILNKLYQSVFSRVITTRYSDCSFWNYCTSMGFTIVELTNTLLKKILVDIIPKYQFNNNIISLNHVVINNSIDYTFRINFPINFKSLNIVEADEDGLTDFDKLAINTARVNESILILSKLNIKFTIKFLLKKYKIRIKKSEYLFYLKNLKLNKLQRNFIFLFFSKYFGSTDGLYYCNFKEYVILVIIMKRIFRRNKFILLPLLLTSNIKEIKEKKILNKKNLFKVVENKKYKYLMNKKYSSSSNILTESNIIIKMIATIQNNKFIFNEFSKSKRINNGKQIKINIDLLSDEYLRFLEII